MEDVKKELQIRERISRIYKKQQADFPDKRGYDDYLEEIEDIIFKLTNNIDVLETEERIRDYERLQAVDEKPAAPDGPATYAPGGLGVTVMPTAITQVTQDAEGRLMNVKAFTSKAQFTAAAAAGGWNPEIGRRRAMQEAFTTIFVF